MNEPYLKKILDGDLKLLDKVDIHEPVEPNIDVVVFPNHVKKMLLLYLGNEINADELNKWAEFLCFRIGEYVSYGGHEEKNWDYYEDMWYVVQKLSTPEIDGEINKETVQKYLQELEKYSSDFPPD